MPTYEVRRVKPALVTVTVEAVDEDRAIIYAQGIFADDARDDYAYEATRQPQRPDDSGDARSEARYEQTTVDDESERIERERWSSAESEGAEA